MDNIDALRTLANAYHYMNDVYSDHGHDVFAEKILFDKFHYIRRSLGIGDCKVESLPDGVVLGEPADPITRMLKIVPSGGVVEYLHIEEDGLHTYRLTKEDITVKQADYVQPNG